MLKKTCVILALLTHLSFATEWIQGQWNGHPWERDKLIQKAKKGDPDAMAEWAYCSYFTENNIPKNREQIHEYARRAAELGSTLGKSMYAYNIISSSSSSAQPKQGLEILNQVAQTEHPFAQFCVAQSYAFKRLGRNDVKKTIEMLEDLSKQDVAQAPPTLAFFLRDKDPERSTELLKKSFDESKNSTATSLQFLNLEKVQRRYGQAYADKVSEHMIVIASLGNQGAYKRILQKIKNSDNPSEIISLLKTPALSRNKPIIELLLTATKDKPSVISSKDSYKIAQAAYSQGSTNKAVIRQYFTGLSGELKQTQNYDGLAQILEEVCLKGIKHGDCNFHNDLGAHLMLDFTNNNGPVENFDRAVSHFIYHLNHAEAYCSYMLAYYYLDIARDERRDLAKGLAAVHAALKSNKGQHQIDCLTRDRDLALIEATDAQKKEAERLIKTGFPNEKGARRRAFEHLKEVGDIPSHFSF